MKNREIFHFQNRLLDTRDDCCCVKKTVKKNTKDCKIKSTLKMYVFGC